MSRLSFSTVRSILRFVVPFGMAESTTSPKDTGTDTKLVFNEFIPGTAWTSVGTHRGTSEDGSNKKTKPWNKPDFDKMSLDDKRSYYKCDNFMTLDHVMPWPSYVLHNQYLFVKEGLLRKDDKINHDNDIINGKVSLWQGDITCLEIDAIVNAANTSLLGGGGVDGCIHRAAGKSLFKECEALNGCKTGHAKITSGYKLPAKKVIHTVGPIGENKKKLRSCYKNCLELVKEHNLRTVAFCCISTGVYGYPYEEAANVAVETVKEWLEENKDEVDRVIFCVFLESDLDIYHQLMLKYFPCTVSVFEEDDEASVKEHSTTETVKGDETGVKKTVGDGVGESDFLPKPPAKARSEEDVGSSDDLDHHAKFNAANSKAQSKEDVGSSDELDHHAKFNAANSKAQSKEEDEDGSGIDSCEKNKMDVDIRDDEGGDDGVAMRAENSGLNEATENDDDEDIEGNSPKAVDEKVEKTEADREMNKRKREGDIETKMDLDVETSEVHHEDGTRESAV